MMEILHAAAVHRHQQPHLASLPLPSITPPATYRLIHTPSRRSPHHVYAANDVFTIFYAICLPSVYHIFLITILMFTPCLSMPLIGEYALIFAIMMLRHCFAAIDAAVAARRLCCDADMLRFFVYFMLPMPCHCHAAMLIIAADFSALIDAATMLLLTMFSLILLLMILYFHALLMPFMLPLPRCQRASFAVVAADYCRRYAIICRLFLCRCRCCRHLLPLICCRC